ncbi:MAG: hypothetical protein KKE24_02410 [Candidatus Thermoplasmatota archaeon]|nr:hypothetical protein [Candidatus Thermoplasmatota archaeon]
MRNTRVTAIAVAAFMLILPLSMVVSAHEDEGTPIMITVPDGADEGATMDCAVFFADNMVYGPQWRIGNFVRIEMLVIDMTGYSAPEEIWTSDIELFDDYQKQAVDGDGNLIFDEFGVPVMVYDGLAQQAAIMTDSINILPKTRMVSVSYIEVTMTMDTLDEPEVFKAGWDPETGDKVIGDELGREVNKAGHVIYGMLWDTTGLDEGTYTVSVRLGAAVEDEFGEWTGVIGQWYSVDFAIAHFYIGEGLLNDPDHPFVNLVSDKSDPVYVDYKIGIGNVTDDGVAWIELGDLIPQGSGGGNSEDSGGSHGENGGGNGDHELGQNGNGRRR